MAIFLAATGPALARLAQRAEWRTDRQNTLLTAQLATDPTSVSDATLLSGCQLVEGLEEKKRSGVSKRHTAHNRLRQTPNS